MSKLRAKPIPMVSIDAATLNPAAYIPINPGGLPEACYALRVLNYCDVSIILSYDGITEHDLLERGEPLYLFPLVDSVLAQGTVFYVKGNVGIGRIYVTGFYSEE